MESAVGALTEASIKPKLLSAMTDPSKHGVVNKPMNGHGEGVFLAVRRQLLAAHHQLSGTARRCEGSGDGICSFVNQIDEESLVR